MNDAARNGSASDLTLHLIPAATWAAVADLPPDARYAPASFAEEGFVHCTDGADELVATANRYYATAPGDFVALTIDLARLDVPWRYDVPGSPYPHIYGTIPRHAIVAIRPMPRGADGAFLRQTT